MPILKKTLSEQIYEILRQELIDEKITFGQKLVNKDLQIRFNVSNTPIRDAINRLQQDGLVEEISTCGAKVIDFSIKTAIDIDYIISILCSSAITLSIQHKDQSVIIKTLENAVEIQKLMSEEYYYYDYVFHRVFFDYCNNDALKSIYQQYSALHTMLIKYYHKNIDSRPKAIEEHINILNAYKSSDVHSAVNYMREHCSNAIENLKFNSSI